MLVEVGSNLAAGVALQHVGEEEGQRVDDRCVVRLPDPQLQVVHVNGPAAHRQHWPSTVGAWLQCEGKGHLHLLRLGVSHTASLHEGEIRLLDCHLQLPEVGADVPGADAQELLANGWLAEGDVDILLAEGKLGETDVADLPVAAVVVPRNLLDVDGRENLQDKVQARILQLADQRLPGLCAGQGGLGAAQNLVGVHAVQPAQDLVLDVLVFKLLEDLGDRTHALHVLELREHLLTPLDELRGPTHYIVIVQAAHNGLLPSIGILAAT
mmetsp:Transcript_54648/g.162663  ORF Transcript_54648/g.162663 Transcript_54648/m.162663 type:complete len:268 (-) Transcript_54648:939-1742(-)